jgi:transmembrane sensor
MINYEAGFNEYLRIAKITGNLTPDEEVQFNNLMEKDQEFQQLFAELKKNLSPALLHELEVYRNTPEMHPTVERIQHKSILRKMVLRTAVAATFLIIVGATTWFLINNNATKRIPAQYAKIELQLSNGKMINLSASKGAITTDVAHLNNTGNALSYSHTSSTIAGMNTLTVAPGMDYQVTLADGSKVWLNSNSRMKFPFSFTGHTREIDIEGEAFFEIAKNNQQPFIVHLPGGAVKVLGTEFNVNTYDTGRVKVSLVSGSVQLTANRDSIQIKPGHQGILVKGYELLDEEFNKRNTLSWMQGKYYFEKSQMNEIVAVISRWYGVQIVVDNDRNNQKKFIGILNKKEPLANFLQTLQFVADIDSYFDTEGKLHLK